jgi:hypothetical protein
VRVGPSPIGCRLGATSADPSSDWYHLHSPCRFCAGFASVVLWATLPTESAALMRYRLLIACFKFFPTGFARHGVSEITLRPFTIFLVGPR